MRKITSRFLMFLSLLVLAGCSSPSTTSGPAATSNPAATAATTTPAATTTSTPEPHGPTLAYIGSDNNVWLMEWPNGTPQQLTTDAQANAPYRGLVWSPDGSRLAVTRADKLVILKTDGTVVVKIPLPAVPAADTGIPVAWSPDGTRLALPGGSTTGGSSDNEVRKLLILDVQSGKGVKTLTYESGLGGECGAPPVSDLRGTIQSAEHLAFFWSPDGQTFLLTRVPLGLCFGEQGIQITIASGTTDSLYPSEGSYQPGGNLILGYWRDRTLGLTDRSAVHVRALVPPEQPDPQYVLGVGLAVWASDGQTVYYEHNDGIWRIEVDGSNARQVVAGTVLDSDKNATVQLVPHPSPDGQMLLYLQAAGSDKGVDDPDPPPAGSTITQWYVAQADGSNPVALPKGVIEAVWRP